MENWLPISCPKGAAVTQCQVVVVMCFKKIIFKYLNDTAKLSPTVCVSTAKHEDTRFTFVFSNTE